MIDQRGDICMDDYDGDGVSDEEDICPENKYISRTDFENIETMDLCKKFNIDSKTKQQGNICTKDEPVWQVCRFYY